MRTYSQKAEQDYILRSVAGIQQGHFWDIGAYNGVDYSNTMALVELGWTGVMVEPGIEAFQGLLKNHGGNPKLTLVHAAVSDLGLIQFWNCPTTFSTTSPSNRDKFIHEGFSHPFYVPSIEVEELFRFGKPDVISIDTEGTSVSVLEEVILSGLRPRCICVEHDGHNRELAVEIVGSEYRVIMENEENYVFQLGD